MVIHWISHPGRGKTSPQIPKSKSKIKIKDYCVVCRADCCGLAAGGKFLTLTEIKNIKKLGHRGFYEKNPGFDFYTIKWNGKYCRFLDPKAFTCTIYGVRPTDCRFYPYDIISKNGIYYWIKWQSKVCLLEKTLPDAQILAEFETNLIPKFKRYLKKYAKYTEHMIAKKENKFKVLREVKI